MICESRKISKKFDVIQEKSFREKNGEIRKCLVMTFLKMLHFFGTHQFLDRLP